MTRVTKKKFVRDEVTNDYDLPTKEQQIVRVVKSCGSNLHEVMTCEGKTFIASMPTKFRRNIWVRIADFVVIDPIVEGDKVKGEISRVLLEDQIRYYKKQGVWPGTFPTLQTDRINRYMEKIGLKKKEEDSAINANDCYMRDDDLPPVSSDESDEDDLPPTSSDESDKDDN